MGMIDPFQSDEQFIKNDRVLSRRQADRDAAERKAKGGFEAALFHKPHNPGKVPAWAKHPVRCRCWDCCTCPACKQRRSDVEDAAKQKQYQEALHRLNEPKSGG